MFTECPTCQTLFRVTGAILRAGHGQVECGQCHTVFDAIERLIDDIPPETSLAPTLAEPTLLEEDASPDPTLAPVDEQWVNDLPTGEFILRDGELIPVADRPSRPLEDSPGPIVVEEPVQPEEITLEGDRIEISGVYRTPEELSQPEEEAPVLPPASDPLITARDDLEDVLAEEEEEETVRSRTFLWSLLSLGLVIALAAQAVHHYRQELVRHPRLGPSLLDLYATLGLPLTPNWDVTGYEIQQWGVAADPTSSETLRLRASIMNRAGFPQPYPLVKLTLEDRWGAQVGAREFEPQEYLGPGIPANRMLAPNQRVNADIGIVDPGEDAVGFHVDICLRIANGIECASQITQPHR